MWATAGLVPRVTPGQRLPSRTFAMYCISAS
jgi:hypothetical protein